MQHSSEVRIDEIVREGRSNERSSPPSIGTRRLNKTSTGVRTRRGTVGDTVGKGYRTLTNKNCRDELDLQIDDLQNTVADLGRRDTHSGGTCARYRTSQTRASEVWRMTVGPEDPGQQRRRDVKGSEGRRSFGRPLARAARFVPTAVGGASAEL